MTPSHCYTLVGVEGRPYPSVIPGRLGGHRRSRLYGRLDCPAALRAISHGGYVKERVFFIDQATAVAAGYRPCAVCLPVQYSRWKRALLTAPAQRHGPQGHLPETFQQECNQ